jgi:hypothetical protein
MNKNLTNIKTEYFLIVNGVKQLFVTQETIE